MAVAMVRGGSPGLLLAAKGSRRGHIKLVMRKNSKPRMDHATLASKKLNVKMCGPNFTVWRLKPHNWMGNPLALTKGVPLHGLFTFKWQSERDALESTRNQSPTF